MGLAIVLVASAFVLAAAVAHSPERDPTRGLASGLSRYVAPTGTSNGDGSKERPLDLATALSGRAPISPGSTVWLRGGTYDGSFRSDLAGTAQQPIIVRSFPGEHAVIDSAPSPKAALAVYGAWTIYRDFEVFSSSRLRESTENGGSQPTDIQRGAGIEVHGSHTKFINLVVHDMTDGFGLWSDAEEAEAYGNIVYHNGWHGGGHNNGHGIYTQNKTGIRRVAENIIFNQFGAGIHAYGTDSAFLDNIVVEGNVAFNNGLLGKRYDRNILIGGGTVAKHPVLKGNHTYFTSGRGLSSGQNNIGYLAGCADLEVRDNHFVAGEFGFALEMVNCTGTVKNNTFFGELRAVEGKALVNYPTVRERFPENTYVERPPTGVEVFVRPNAYERGRAHIIVYNWDKKDSVTVDLSGAQLEQGAEYEVRDAQNYFGDPVTSGVYNGKPVKLPMSGLTVAAPTGEDLQVPAHTGPEFAVFVVSPPAEPLSLLSRMTAAVRRLF